MKHKRSELWDVVRDMPPLKHSMPNEAFDIMESEVVQWMIEQPEVRQILFNSVKNREIIYDAVTGTWEGVDFGD